MNIILTNVAWLCSKDGADIVVALDVPQEESKSFRNFEQMCRDFPKSRQSVFLKRHFEFMMPIVGDYIDIVLVSISTVEDVVIECVGVGHVHILLHKNFAISFVAVDRV